MVANEQFGYFFPSQEVSFRSRWSLHFGPFLRLRAEVGSEEVAKLKELLKNLSPNARQFTAERGAIPLRSCSLGGGVRWGMGADG